MPTSIDCRPNGSIKELQYGSQQGAGRKYTTTQNARQLPANLKVVLGTSTLANLTHSYDANGNVTFIDDAVNGSSFDRSMGYDDLDRLESASGFWGAGSYSFDALGNIRTKTESGIDLDYTYSASTNRLASIDDTVGSADYSFSYDSYGNVTNNGSQGFAYNLAGQMTSSTNPSVAYQYDGHNRRVQKTEGGQTGYTVYGANGRLMHKRKGGVSTHYLYAGSLLIAEKQGSTLHYIHTDLLGSPIRGDDGTSYSEHYRPWGEKKDHPPQLADDVGYTGHQSDVATGLTYMQARYYDPIVGRFMAMDPVQFMPDNPSSFGRYEYAYDNPYKYNDPDGRTPETLLDAYDVVTSTGRIGAAVAAYLVGTVTGNEALAYEAAEGLRDERFNAGATLAGLALPFVSGRMIKTAGHVPNSADEFVDLTSPQRRRHILDGDATGGGHRPGTGKPGKSEFPAGRSDDSIINDISDIATDPSLPSRAGRDGRTITDGTRNGVDIRVIQERNGDIVSGYPTNTPRNPR